ncbi:ATP-binding protein [Paenibacillus xylanilyticus]|uniref:ATP-binding protein n=1 Tax=Paenibacillus xylanilyticus TaxID=248903 RepID=UPI0028A80EE6|nr:ATP-binding protein [Paenibacillus xylanilyticus]
MSERTKVEEGLTRVHRVPKYIWVTIGITLLTPLLHVIGMSNDLVNVSLIYLFPILVSAVFWGLGPAIYAASLSVLMFDFFFVPPNLSFTVADLRYIFSFGVYLAVAVLTATLSSRLRQQLEMVRQREATTNSLYALSRQMTAVTDLDTLLNHIANQVSHTLGTEAAVYLPDAHGELTITTSAEDHVTASWGEEESEIAIAKWVYRTGETAGRGSSSLRESSGLYVPLRTENQIHGVLAVRMETGDVQEQREQLQLLEACGGLAASAIARVKLAEEARLAQLTAESERIRTALLDSVSHELRTPLTAIIGSATGLIENDAIFTPEDRKELTGNIRDGAMRMNRLVTNLLGMVKLESGMLQLRRKWCDVGDMISVVLVQVREFSKHRTIRVDLPEQPSFICGDEILLEQVLVNVVSNAIKYSPDYSEIVITVTVDENNAKLTIVVADAGIGIPDIDRERIFEKFYRSESSRHVTGTGLGLAICKGIVEVHGGTIGTEPNPGGGTRVSICLPMEVPDALFPYMEQGEVE